MRRTFKADEESTLRRIVVPIGLALLSAALAYLAPILPSLKTALAQLSYDVFYDSFYKFRPIEDQSDGPVVIVAVDDHSLLQQSAERGIGWPWPRDQWGCIIQYAEHCGAKAVAFDMLFSEPSVFNRLLGDDAALADAAAKAKIPVIFGVRPDPLDPKPTLFAPSDPDLKTWKPTLGTTNVPEGYTDQDDYLRRYMPRTFFGPSLAVATLQAIGRGADAFNETFLLHFYGPSVYGQNKQTTFRYVSAINLIDAFDQWQKGNEGGAQKLADPALFKDKIVLIGAITAGTYDLKKTPMPGVFPGVEYQATAIVNMLQHQRVQPAKAAYEAGLLLSTAFLGAFGAGILRRASAKVIWSAGTLAVTPAISLHYFNGPVINWLSPAAPLVAGLLAVGTALLWSFLVEDRHRRFFVKALGQYVSPAVAEELAHNPDQLRISSERREMTVMFTDIAGFTDLSEKLEAEALAKLLNFYLDEMSNQVLAERGTVDKYVGDAIMSFWNAPLPQEDHAFRACRAALAMHAREKAIGEDLARLGGPGLHTRLGINTGIMAVGNMGCTQKFNYSVLGDPVNLASRLEGQNKAYNTSILISQSTAAVVGKTFRLRKIDCICVKGKLQPISVYELMSDDLTDPKLAELATEYEAALDCYQKQKWDESEQRIAGILKKFPDDGPCKTLIKRIAAYRHDPPPANWDGVYIAKEK